MRSLVIRAVTGGLLAIAVAASLAVPGRAQRDQDWSKISFKVTQLTPSLYMLQGQGGFSGGNIAVSVGDDGLLIVDDSFAPLGRKLQAELKKLSKKPLKIVMNTHCHDDHTGGNVVFGPQAMIIAHENTRVRLARDGNSDKPVPAPPAALPVVTLQDSLTVHLNGEEIRALHVPAAHTDSDLRIQFVNANVVHLGDLFFNGMFPFIDTSKGGSVHGYLDAIDGALKDLPAGARIIPGHGPLATRQDLEAFQAMMKESVATVEKGLADGKSLEQLKKDKVLAKFDAAWGGGFMKSDDFTELLFQALQKK